MGRDPERCPAFCRRTVFQSTRPVWGATDGTHAVLLHRSFQSTRPVWGATSNALIDIWLAWNFNPRAPCGARPLTISTVQPAKKFQSTRPMRGATSPVADARRGKAISIHAPHAGRDYLKGHFVYGLTYFNPRAPCGARHPCIASFFNTFAISIHAPHAGRDSVASSMFQMDEAFQSTRPMRGATILIIQRRG